MQNQRTKAQATACAACRRRKTKCDATKPVCSQCHATGASCQYFEHKKTGLPRGYVRSLEAEIEALRAENESLRPSTAANASSEPRAQPQTDQGLDELQARAQPQRAYCSPPNSVGIHLSPTATLPDHDVMMQDPFDLAATVIADLLTLEERSYLRTLFFERCHPFIPVLHEPSFTFNEQDIHLTLALFAISSRHDEVLKTKSETLYMLAKQTTQATLLNPDISTLIAMLFLAVYEIGHPNTSLHAWTTIGSALSLVSSFRLLSIDDYQGYQPSQWVPAPRDWVEEEGRRRTALMTISLARWFAAIQGRDIGVLIADRVHLKLPVSDEVWFAAEPKRPETDRPDETGRCSSLGPLARFVQVIEIYSQINVLNRGHRRRDAEINGPELERIDGLIETYLQTFPSDWQNQSMIGGEHLMGVTTISLAHCASLLLHHPVLPARHPKFHSLATQRISVHAEEILDVIHFAHIRPINSNYMLPHPLLLASRVRLGELLERKGHCRGRDMDLLVNGLLSLGKNWGLEERLSAHVTRIQKHELLLQEPLTNFEPRSSGQTHSTTRQREVTLVHCRFPLLFGTDLDGMPSIRAMPGQTSVFTTGNANVSGREETGIYPGQLNRHLLMSNPLEWSAELFGVDFDV